MADAEYRIPSGMHRGEQVVERSRFIATLAHAATPESARALIDAVRAEFPDATHNCWAYVAGPPGDTRAIGMSDAGEPHGTAGRPMLDVLLHSGTGEIAAVVTRYYGGVKLGKGGLARAYGGAVQHALEDMPTAVRVLRDPVEVSVGYADVDTLRRLLDEYAAEVSDEQYGADVRYRVELPRRRRTEFERELAERTAGRGSVTAHTDDKEQR
jgi:uncharacterized YigZ family protein